LSRCHKRKLIRDAGAKGIEEEAFEGVIVERAEGVGDIEAMMTGVEGC
jgi:hypothetical protein